MLKPQKQKEQMESLRKTKSTKEQILKKIEESSVEELKSMVPEAPPGLDKEYILKNAEKMILVSLPRRWQKQSHPVYPKRQ